MNVIGYVRVSTEDQAREGVSIDSQIEKIKAYCIAKDWSLVNIYVDEGASAKTLHRTGVQDVITLLASSKSKSKKDIDAVIVYKLDRLTRSVVDLNRLIELFDKYDVALVSLVESLDATSASGRLMLNLLASVSQRNVKSLESGRRMLWHFLNQEIEYIHGRCMAIRLITVVTATA